MVLAPMPSSAGTMISSSLISTCSSSSSSALVMSGSNRILQSRGVLKQFTITTWQEKSQLTVRLQPPMMLESHWFLQRCRRPFLFCCFLVAGGNGACTWRYVACDGFLQPEIEKLHNEKRNKVNGKAHMITESKIVNKRRWRQFVSFRLYKIVILAANN